MKSKVLLHYICIFNGFLAVKCFSVNNTLYEFQKYVVRFGKNYSENSYEFQRRLQIFTDHLKEHHKLNRLSNCSKFAAKYGITKFSDLSPEEFKDLYLRDLIANVKPSNLSRNLPVEKLRQLNIPNKLDWRSNRDFSVVTPVKNQLKCGGCWAFSTVETVESMAAISANAAVTALSVQQVIDCSSSNWGCQGGNTCQALKWMVTTKTPIFSETLYPLTDESKPCKTEPNGTIGIVAKDYKCYKEGPRPRTRSRSIGHAGRIRHYSPDGRIRSRYFVREFGNDSDSEESEDVQVIRHRSRSLGRQRLRRGRKYRRVHGDDGYEGGMHTSTLSAASEDDLNRSLRLVNEIDQLTHKMLDTVGNELALSRHHSEYGSSMF